MKRGIFRFRTRTIDREAAPVEESALAAEPSRLSLELERQDPPMADRDEVILLLHTAAEIEHNLLAQYLYSAYSLDASALRSAIIEIAREEMAHLLSIQNLLRSLGGPVNLEREDFPFNNFYPFPFQLEPFSLRSIARYVLAEMPAVDTIPPELGFVLNEVKLDAGVDEPGEVINRVGALFALLLELVDKLQPGDFRANTTDLQESGDDWGIFGSMIVDLIHDKNEARSLIEKIGRQGEGPDESGEELPSHFRRFFQIYRDLKSHSSEPVARLLPTNPTTRRQSSEGEEAEPGYISNPLARAWANLFDTRYRILLTDLAHVLAIPLTNRTASRRLIRLAVLKEMFDLSRIADVLTTLPQHDPPQTEHGTTRVAGPPFALPYTLQLPDQDLDRWRYHEQLLTEAALRIAAVRRELTSTHELLDRITASDTDYLSFVQDQIRALSAPTPDDNSDDNDDADGNPPDNPTEGFVLAGNADLFPLMSVTKITVQAEERVLYHADPMAAGIDTACPFYVSQLYCWHRHPETHPTIHCEMSGTGVLAGKQVTCQTPYKAGCAHGSKYDITTGQRLQGPANRDLIVYATKLIEGQIWVSVTPITQTDN